MIQRARDALAQGTFLNEFVPVPDQLKDTAAAYYGNEELQQQHQACEEQNLNTFGYKNWYDFCVAEWGTKWDVGGEDCYVEIDHINPGCLYASFQSAWAPPLDAYRKMEQLGFRISAYYYESGMGFCGHYSQGEDDGYELGSMSPEEVQDMLPEDIDQAFNIVEDLRSWQEENS
jgi:hypothetical protein